MRILLATDLSTSAKSAGWLVASIPWPAGSTLRVLSVVEPAPVLLRGFAPAVRFGATAERIDEVADAVRALARSFERPDRAVETKIRAGRPADEIDAEARRFTADAVVVGSRGRGPLAAALLGSVASEVVDGAPCPVLVARAETLTRLVLADDGSAGARQAAEVIEAWPFLRELPVRVVTVTRPGLESERDANERAAAVARRGVRAVAETRHGDAAREIVAAARDAGADLIVVGSRGDIGLTRFLLGSVARGVLSLAPCSVLVVRQRRRTAEGSEREAERMPVPA